MQTNIRTQNAVQQTPIQGGYCKVVHARYLVTLKIITTNHSIFNTNTCTTLKSQVKIY